MDGLGFVPPVLITTAEAMRITGLTVGALRYRRRIGVLHSVQVYPRARHKYFAHEIAALAQETAQVRVDAGGWISGPCLDVR